MMKILLLTSMFCSLAFAEIDSQIYLMTSREFTKGIQHVAGKKRYLAQITPLLKKLRVKTTDFNADEADVETVYATIQNQDKWDKVVSFVETKCKKIETDKKIRNLDALGSQSCVQLKATLSKIYDWIGENPEGQIGSKAGGAAGALR